MNASKRITSLNNRVELNDLWPIIDEVISSGGEFQFKPNGISMLPLIRPGVDTVTLVSPNEVKKTDIVLYRRDNGKFVLHRIMLVRKKDYVMCGDNQNYYEAGIRRDQILALVKDIQKDGKSVDTASDEYKKYVKSLYRKTWKARIRVFLSRIKHAIFK